MESPKEYVPRFTEAAKSQNSRVVYQIFKEHPGIVNLINSDDSSNAYASLKTHNQALAEVFRQALGKSVRVEIQELSTQLK
jgi:hypothetical protein